MSSTNRVPKAKHSEWKSIMMQIVGDKDGGGVKDASNMNLKTIISPEVEAKIVEGHQEGQKANK
ncbi:MAG: hypothetical protein ACI33P_15855 [Lysinibacillus sp.]